MSCDYFQRGQVFSFLLLFCFVFEKVFLKRVVRCPCKVERERIIASLEKVNICFYQFSSVRSRGRKVETKFMFEFGFRLHS